MTDDTTAQSALDAWGSDGEDNSDSEAADSRSERSHEGTRVNAPVGPSISDDAVMTDSSCPWCLHPSTDFRLKYEQDYVGTPIRNPMVSCGNCGNVVPVDADWYRDGEKIV